MKQKTDENILSEMIFGSVALALRGTTFKVHWLEDRIMISQVFLAPVQMTNGHTASRQSQSTRLNIQNGVIVDGASTEGTSVNSLSLSICVKSDNALSHPLDVPEEHSGSAEVRGSTGDSGYSGTDPWTATSTTSSRVSNRSSLASVFSDIDISHHNARKHSIDSMAGGGGGGITEACMTSSSSGNIQRRISRHLSTSMENRLTYPDLVGQLGEYYMSCHNVNASELSVPRLRRNSEIVPPERGTAPDVRKRKAVSGDVLMPGSRRSSARRPRLGIAVMFMLNKGSMKEMKLFCSEHMLMLEGMINRLRMAVEMAYISRQKFLHIMLGAFHETSSWLCDLFTAPRIKFPIWISLSTGFVHNAVQLAAQFMKDLNMLMNQLDTKETNFFISRLLTAVLTCHLGWVNTVAPICVQSQIKRDGSSASVETLVNEERVRLSEISKLHPYNALWAQLGDLHGAVGTPLRIAKTVVYGNESSLKIVERILNILTYFIRCGEIKRLEVLKKIDNKPIGPLIEESLTRKPSNTTLIVVKTEETQPKIEPKNKMMRRSNTQKSNLALLDQQETSSASSSSSNIHFQMESETSLVVKGRFQVSATSDVTDGVVFVLGGDNEELVGIGKEVPQEIMNGAIKKIPSDTCSKPHKKHSGVKFNFEKYPQIAKNYMRNKNLEMNNYEFFEKGLKMELQWKLNYDQTQTKSKLHPDPEDECECCKGGGAHYLQTPSNASELEFSSDDPLQEQHTSTPRIVISEAQTTTTCLTTQNHTKLPLTYFTLDETREVNIVRHDTPQINLIELPFRSDSVSHPKVQQQQPTTLVTKPDKFLPGFSPSLFVGLSNHFISDMILQGIITTRNDGKWEESLRQDLLYAAKCISLEQVPIENVAIVANIDKW